MKDKKDHSPRDHRQPGNRRKKKILEYKGDDRRKTRRIKGIMVEFKVHESEDESESAFLRDMSLRGLSISLAREIEVGVLLDLKIYLSGAIRPAVVTAEVRWVRPSEYFLDTKNDHFDLGLKTVIVEERDLKLIDAYIEEHRDKNISYE